MQDFDTEAFPEDDKIEISDLDAPGERKTSSLIYRILKVKGLYVIYASPRARIIFFVLILLLGGSVLAYQLTASLRPKPTSVTYGVLQVINTSMAPAANFAVVNGIAYIFTEDGKVNAQRASDGKFLWRSKQASTLSQPVIADPFIFLALQNNRGDQIDALRASDGKLQWSFQTPLLVSQPLLIKDGVVYMLTQTGTIEALSENSGKQLWQLATGETNSMNVNGVLYSFAQVTAIRINQTVYFVRTQDGSRLWHYTINPPDTPTSWQPDIEGDIAYIHTNTNALQARSLINGHLRWQYTANNENSWSSTLQNGIVYMYKWTGTIEAVRGQDGSLLWQHNGGINLNRWNAYQRGILIFTQSDESIEALRASDGTLIWQFKPSMNSNISWPSTANNGFLYVITHTSEAAVFALRTLNGSVAWHHPLTNSESQFLLVVTNNALYTWQSDGSIDAWSSRNGQHLWHYYPAIPIAQGPTEVDGLVYLRQGDGTIIVLRAQDGKAVWSDTASANP